MKHVPRVEIRDLTLREGGQAADIAFGAADKLSIARRLCAAGVTPIQVGMPGRVAEDAEAFRLMKRERLAATIEALILGYTPDWQQQTDAALVRSTKTSIQSEVGHVKKTNPLDH